MYRQSPAIWSMDLLEGIKACGYKCGYPLEGSRLIHLTRSRTGERILLIYSRKYLGSIWIERVPETDLSTSGSSGYTSGSLLFLHSNWALVTKLDPSRLWGGKEAWMIQIGEIQKIHALKDLFGGSFDPAVSRIFGGYKLRISAEKGE